MNVSCQGVKSSSCQCACENLKTRSPSSFFLWRRYCSRVQVYKTLVNSRIHLLAFNSRKFLRRIFDTVYESSPGWSWSQKPNVLPTTLLNTAHTPGTLVPVCECRDKRMRPYAIFCIYCVIVISALLTVTHSVIVACRFRAAYDASLNNKAFVRVLCSSQGHSGVFYSDENMIPTRRSY